MAAHGQEEPFRVRTWLTEKGRKGEIQTDTLPGAWDLSRRVRRAYAERISLDLLAEIRQQLVDASRDRAVSLDLARPGPLARIVGKRQLEAMALPQPRCVGRRRHEARATEIEITLARSFRRQPQTMPEFKLGLEEIAAQPVDRLGAQRSGPDRFRAGPSNHRSRLQHGSIVAQNLGIADPGVDHRHMRTLVPEHAHDCVELGPTL